MNKAEQATNELIESHVSYAHAIAAELLGRFPSHVDRNEINSAAELGLVQAAKAFDASRKIAFSTFAYYRVRGAVFDLLRQTARSNRFQEAANEYMQDYAGGPAADAPNPSYEEIKGIAASVVTSYFLSLENLAQEPAAGDNEAPIDKMVRLEQQSKIRAALATLPEKNRRVLEAYYFEDMTLDDIGKRLGLSKSWVSRMHAKGLELLRPIVGEIVGK
jgi:RNA polymerase sigma factor for flagellar operon FliA